MKKILLVHTRYRITGGEDIAVENEILALKKVYDVETLIFSNNEIDNIFKQIIYFLINKNSQSDRLLEKKLNSFKPDMVYIHNTWFKASLGIFRLLKKHNTKFVIKLHNYRFECGRFFFKTTHLKGNSLCSACGYHKTDTFLFNKYFKDSYIKSLLLIIYCKQYYKILKNSNVLTLSNFQKQYLINDGFDSKNLKILHNPLNINGDHNNQKSINLSSKSYIIYAGLISEEKGIRSLIDTYNLLNKYEKKLVIVGEGPLLETFKKENKNNQIIFLGKQSNIQVLNLIKNSYSVITNTKLYEGQPTLLSEASMLGINSVYPRNGGIEEFFPKDNPFSFEVNSSKDLLEKFSLLQNSELVESQSNENFRHIEKALSKENYLNSFREIVKW